MRKNLGSVIAMYPLPVAVVGSEQEGRINYNAIAHVGVMDFQTLSLSMGKSIIQMQELNRIKR